jgi:hypothetical protein
MAQPPIRPAKAAASWNPDALTATASVGAAPAAATTRVCMPGMIAKASMPSTKVSARREEFDGAAQPEQDKGARQRGQ